MAKSRKKSAKSEGNPQVAIGVIGGIAALAAAAYFLGGQGQPAAPQPVPVPVVQAAPPDTLSEFPSTIPGRPAASPNPPPGENVPATRPSPAVTPPGGAPTSGTAPATRPDAKALANDAPADGAGRVRPKQRPPEAVEVQAQVSMEQDLDREPRSDALAGYAATLKLTGVGYNAERKGDWKVEPDPLPAGLPENKQAQKLKAKINTFPASWDEMGVLFPVVPSPFVIVGGNSGRDAFREVFNLGTAKSSGQIKGLDFRPEVHALSPDGKYYAAVIQRTPLWIEIWDIPKKTALEHLPAVPEDALPKPDAPPPPPPPPPGNDAIKIGPQRPVAAPRVPRIEVPNELEARMLAFPRADRLLVASEARLQIWSLPDRQPVSDIDLFDPFPADAKHRARFSFNRGESPVANMAFSPGGRYGALLYAGEEMRYELQILELETGQTAGAFALQKRKDDFWSNSKFHGLSFSPAGTELAALFETDKGCRILIWDLQSGEIADWIPFGLDQKPRWPTPYTPIQWFPDGQRLLVDGTQVIDRKIDSWIFSVPESRSRSPHSRRIVNADTLTVVDDSAAFSAGLIGYRLDLETFDKAADLVAVGGSAIDTVLPPVTKVGDQPIVDRTQQDAVPWSVEADPGPKLAETLNDASAKVPEVNVFTEVRNSRVDASRVFFGLSSRSSDARNPPRVEIVDLLKRKTMKPLTPGYPFKLLACSPAGRRVALRPEARKPTGRIEIYDAETGAPVCSWRPYDESRPEAKRKDLHSAMFLDEDHVGTLSDGGRFVIWEIPSCKPLYARDLSMVLMPTASPGGRYLAFVYEDAVELCESLTGLLKGEFLTGNPAVGISFHPDGDKMAAVLEAVGNRYMVRVDLATGALSPTYVIPGLVSDQTTSRERAADTPGPKTPLQGPGARVNESPEQVALQWCGPKRVLIDHSQLFDFESRRVVWTYVRRQMLVWLDAGDGRLWYATYPRFEWANRRATLASRLFALSLPHDEAEAEILRGVQTPVRLVLKPGGKIRLGSGVTGNAAVRDHVIKEFARLQIVAANDADVTLDFATSSATGPAVRYIGGGGEQTLQIRTVTLKATITSGGVTHWETSYSSSNNAGFMTFFDPKVGLQSTQDRQLDRSVTNMPYRFRAPAYVIHRDDQNGFGTTELTDQGPVSRAGGTGMAAVP